MWPRASMYFVVHRCAQLYTLTPTASSRHSDLIANPVQVWANVDLGLLRCVPPVVTAIAMAAAHCFVGAINSFFGRHYVDSVRKAFWTLHFDLTAQKSGCSTENRSQLCCQASRHSSGSCLITLHFSGPLTTVTHMPTVTLGCTVLKSCVYAPS